MLSFLQESAEKNPAICANLLKLDCSLWNLHHFFLDRVHRSSSTPSGSTLNP